MIVSKDQVRNFIPQGDPFVMVHELHEINDHFARTGFTIPQEHYFSHNGYFTPSGILENIAQSAALFSGWHVQNSGEDPKTGFIASIAGFKLLELPAVDGVLETTITKTQEVMGFTFIEGSSICANKKIAECTMKIFHP